ncbi:hypothetical protein [Mesorhizobium sp. 10J20-29]
MNSSTFRKIVQAAAIVGIATVSMSATATPSLAYSCKAYPEQADAYLKTKFAARAKAIKNWSYKTKNQYGLAWSVWDIAKDKSVECKKVSGKWSCKAKAKPCLYVVP